MPYHQRGYRSLRRIVTILMVTVSGDAAADPHRHQPRPVLSTLEREMENPLYAMVRKSQTSLELFPRQAGLHRQPDRPCLQL